MLLSRVIRRNLDWVGVLGLNMLFEPDFRVHGLFWRWVLLLFIMGFMRHLTGTCSPLVACHMRPQKWLIMPSLFALTMW